MKNKDYIRLLRIIVKYIFNFYKIYIRNFKKYPKYKTIIIIYFINEDIKQTSCSCGIDYVEKRINGDNLYYLNDEEYRKNYFYKYYKKRNYDDIMNFQIILYKYDIIYTYKYIKEIIIKYPTKIEQRNNKILKIKKIMNKKYGK